MASLSALVFVPFPVSERTVQIDISLSTNFCAFSRARESLARTLWRKLQPYCCCQGFGQTEPTISVATPPSPSAPSAVGLAPSPRQQANSCKGKKRLRFRSNGYSIFPSAKDRVPRQRGCAKDRSVRPGTFVRCVVLFLSFFRYRALYLQKQEREGLATDSLVKITTVLLLGGLGKLSLRSALQRLLRLRLHRHSGLRPLQGS